MPTTPTYIIDADAVATAGGLSDGDPVSSISVAGGTLTQSGSARPTYNGPLSAKGHGGHGVISGTNDGSKYIGGVVANLYNLFKETADWTMTVLARYNAPTPGGTVYNALFSLGYNSQGILVLTPGISGELQDAQLQLYRPSGGGSCASGIRLYDGNIASITLTAKNTGGTPYLAWFINGMPAGVTFQPIRTVVNTDPFVLLAQGDGGFGGTWDIFRARMYNYALALNDAEAMEQAQEDAALIGETQRTFNWGAVTVGYGDSLEEGFYSDAIAYYELGGIGSTGDYNQISRNSWMRRAHTDLIARDGLTYPYYNWGRPGRTIVDLVNTYNEGVSGLLNHLGYWSSYVTCTLGEGYNSRGSIDEPTYSADFASIVNGMKGLSNPPGLIILRDNPYRAAFGANPTSGSGVLDQYNTTYDATDYSSGAPAGVTVNKLTLQPHRDAMFIEDNYTEGTDVHWQEAQHQRVTDGFDGITGPSAMLLSFVPASVLPITTAPVITADGYVDGGVEVNATLPTNAATIEFQIDDVTPGDGDPANFPYPVMGSPGDGTKVRARGKNASYTGPWSREFYPFRTGGGGGGTNSLSGSNSLSGGSSLSLVI